MANMSQGDFPPPSCHITDGQPLWQWCEVAYWLRRNGLIGFETLYDSVDVMSINTQLDCHWAQQSNPAAFESISDALKGLYQNVAGRS